MLRLGFLSRGRDSGGAGDGSLLGGLAGLLSSGSGLSLGLGLSLLGGLGLLGRLGLLSLGSLLGDSLGGLVLGLVGRLLSRLALALDGSTELGEGVGLGLLAIRGGGSLLAGAGRGGLGLLAEAEGERGLPLVRLQVLLLAVDGRSGLSDLGRDSSGVGNLSLQGGSGLDARDDRSLLNHG